VTANILDFLARILSRQNTSHIFINRPRGDLNFVNIFYLKKSSFSLAAILIKLAALIGEFPVSMLALKILDQFFRYCPVTLEEGCSKNGETIF